MGKNADPLGPRGGAGDQIEYSVGIFSCREAPETLMGAVRAAQAGCIGTRSVIDVLVNGNPELAATVAQRVRIAGGVSDAAKGGMSLRVWEIPLGDKAHSINTYIHEVAPRAQISFFVDGYAAVMPDAFRLIAEALDAAPARLAASGVPSEGRSAAALRQQMLQEGGIHGNLFALRGETMGRLIARDVRLPLGLYRTDGTLGAALCFDLDPARNDWDPQRILVHPEVTWRNLSRPSASFSTVLGYLRRRQRQARGVLENAAVREHLAVRRQPPGQLPAEADQMILSWARERPRGLLRLALRDPLCLLALRRARGPRDWSLAKRAPELLAEITF